MTRIGDKNTLTAPVATMRGGRHGIFGEAWRACKCAFTTYSQKIMFVRFGNRKNPGSLFQFGLLGRLGMHRENQPKRCFWTQSGPISHPVLPLPGRITKFLKTLGGMGVG